MDLGSKIALTSGGIFFLTALTTGIWKHHQMLNRVDHLAHPYVDTAHRAALLYSFATVLIAVMSTHNSLPEGVRAVAVSGLVFFFGTAIATYIRIAATESTDNQFRERNFNTTVGMWLLILVEIGGFAVLFAGFLDSEIL